MKTKVTVLGSNDVEQTEKKKIEFVKQLTGVDATADNVWSKPSDYDNIMLLRTCYGGGSLDAMYAYNDNNENFGCIFMGHFNDGIA